MAEQRMKEHGESDARNSSRFRIDPRESGAPDEEGNPRKSDRRLYVQLLAYTGVRDESKLIDALNAARPAFEGVLYADAHDPRGVALLSWHEKPDGLMKHMREIARSGAFEALTARPELTMLGRTYTIGYERDLEETLITRPKQLAVKREWPWVSWYPLRRSGSFEELDHAEQRKVLGEHGRLGRAFAEEGFGRDIRLACYGMDRNDNDFVIGLTGPDLHRLSHIVGEMRKTVHTSQYLERLGPFFVGKAIWWGDPQ